MKYFIEKLARWRKGILLNGLVLPLLLLVLMPGCAGHPSKTAVQPWPLPPPPGYAMLMIYWTTGDWSEGGGAGTIYIDDVKTFKMHVNHYSWLYVKAGPHVFRSEWGFKAFNWNPESGLNIKKPMTLQDGKSYYIKMRNWVERDRYAFSYADHIYTTVKMVPEKAAKMEATTCWFHKPLVSRIETTAPAQ